ncbi:hypothetical protein LMJ37_15500 [Xanthomonas citri pv. glycines]|nr:MULTISPECIES: hypothetical protein [Xanthomonas]UIX74730.1 hypothetical protein LMJ37_15500 [Xanthomonas citri pv. glycines]
MGRVLAQPIRMTLTTASAQYRTNEQADMGNYLKEGGGWMQLQRAGVT